MLRGNWWEIYQDPQLNSLEEQINVSNQNLKIAQAQFAQARAALKISRSNYFPTVSASPAAARIHPSENRPLFNTSATKTYSDYVIPFDASYEADVWGRVRRTVEASRSEAQASAADLASVDLSLHAELAVDYFGLRGLDAEKALLSSTVVSYEKALELTQNRYHGGLASAVGFTYFGPTVQPEIAIVASPRSKANAGVLFVIETAGRIPLTSNRPPLLSRQFEPLRRIRWNRGGW